MISMTVRDLIEKLEECPPDYPVVVLGDELVEVSEVLIRDELFFTEDHIYKDDLVVKIC